MATSVLIAEDDPVSREMLSATLSLWGYHPVEACDGCEAVERLTANNHPRLAILDWMMPHLEGPEVIQQIRAQANDEYTYFILLTTRTNRDARLTGLESGADDFLTKPFDPDELRLRLRTGMRVLDLQDRVQSAHAALKKKLDRDSLTGVASRDALFDALERECHRAERLGTPFSVLSLDIDRFKDVNDEYGHPAGDKALQHVASLLKSRTRPYDVCGRIGGDEFMIVLPDCMAQQASRTAERIRAAVADNPLQLEDADIRITTSIGLISRLGSEQHSIDDVVSAADSALYAAKRSGRNQVCESMMNATGH